MNKNLNIFRITIKNLISIFTSKTKNAYLNNPLTQTYLRYSFSYSKLLFLFSLGDYIKNLFKMLSLFVLIEKYPKGFSFK